MERKKMKDYIDARTVVLDPITVESVGGHAILPRSFEATDDGYQLITRNSWSNEWWNADDYRDRFEGFAWKAATVGEFTPRSWKAAWKRERYFRQVYNKAARALAGGKCKRRRAARIALATLERLLLQRGPAMRAVCVCPED